MAKPVPPQEDYVLLLEEMYAASEWFQQPYSLMEILYLAEATFLGYLMTVSRMVKAHERSGGWFYHTYRQIEEKLHVPKGQQVRLFKNLVDIGYITTERRGCPAKRFIRIEYQKIRAAILERREQVSTGGTEPDQQDGPEPDQLDESVPDQLGGPEPDQQRKIDQTTSGKKKEKGDGAVAAANGRSGGASAPGGALLLPSPTPPEESRKTSKAATSPSPTGKGRPKDKEGKDTTSKYIVREPTKEERGRTYYTSFDLVSMSECPPDPPAGMVVRNWTDDCSGETRNYLENMRSIPLNWVFPNPDYVPPSPTTPPSPTPSTPAPAVDGYRPMTGKIRRPAGVDPSIEDIHIHLQAELRRIVRGRKVAWGATSGSANTWAQDMKRLVKAVGVPRIEAVLDYLAKNINEIERPAILSASQFVSRFDWLENLRKKHQERPY